MRKLTFSLMLMLLGFVASVIGAEKKVVFIAGPPSHGPGSHEHYAGCALLKKCLDEVPGYKTVVYREWPENSAAFDGADAIVIYSDGQGNHPVLQENRLQTIGALMKKGVGLALIHYAVEPTPNLGHREFLQWAGGCFEINWSVNPFWTPQFLALPKHPICNGVKPFLVDDEWYFHMRFVEGMKGVTPILSAVAPKSTMARPDDAHGGNPAAREAVKRGEPQHVAWAFQRPDGGRGFGFTGGHSHTNWGNDDFRKVVLNAIVWVAKGEVPAQGVESKVSKAELGKNLDAK